MSWRELSFFRQRWNCIWARAHTFSMLSRKSSKQDSLSFVLLRTEEEHVPDSSREWSIVLPLRLKRQWQKRKGHRRLFKLSRCVSMVTRRFQELPSFFQSDVALTRCFYPSLNTDNASQWRGRIGITMTYWNFKRVNFGKCVQPMSNTLDRYRRNSASIHASDSKMCGNFLNSRLLIFNKSRLKQSSVSIDSGGWWKTGCHIINI